MNELEVMETQINCLKDMYKESLISKLESTIKWLEIELDNLKNNPHHKPNSCGILQSSANEIDNLAVKLGVLDSIKR